MLKWLALALLLPCVALAEGMPRQASETVNDFAGILSDATEARLAKQLEKARTETGVEVVLVTMNRRANHGGAGQSIETYALRLFNTWGIGDRKRNDGVLILVAKADREMRIQLGKGFSRDWDPVAQDVIDRSFLPGFRADAYSTTIESGVSATIARIVHPFANGHNAPRVVSPVSHDEGPDNFLIYVLIFIGGVFVVARGLAGDIMMHFKPCPKCNQKALERSRTVLQPSTTYSSGRGEMTTTCRNCDYRLVQAYTIARERDSSDRDQDGGSSGGGRSSGGGASGRW